MRKLFNFNGNCLVIAEVAQAHEGSLAIAHSYIDAISQSGADAVKFQFHIASEESSLSDEFRVVNRYFQDQNRFEYWQRMEFTKKQWIELKSHAEDLGLLFLCSPFSIKAAKILEEMNIGIWKLASGEIENYPMIDVMLASNKPIMLSTGMSTLSQIDSAINYLKKYRAENDLLIMQCTSSYPCPPESIGLNMLDEFNKRYTLPVGLSDHSGKIYPSIVATSLGAKAIEVHVTFDKRIFGFDAESSITIDELKQLVEGIRFTERMLKSPVKKDNPGQEVEKNIKLFKKTIVLNCNKKGGDILRFEDFKFLKPLSGIPSNEIESILGKKIKYNLLEGHFMQWNDIDHEA